MHDKQQMHLNEIALLYLEVFKDKISSLYASGTDNIDFDTLIILYFIIVSDSRCQFVCYILKMNTFVSLNCLLSSIIELDVKLQIWNYELIISTHTNKAIFWFFSHSRAHFGCFRKKIVLQKLRPFQIHIAYLMVHKRRASHA